MTRLLRSAPIDVRARRLRTAWAAGETREDLLPERDGEGVHSDDVAGDSQFPPHVIDRELAFPHGNCQITDAIAGGRRLRAALRLAEEGGAFLRVVAELIVMNPIY
jgi:hypothetical protein